MNRAVVNRGRNKLTSRTFVGTGGTISGIGQFLKSVKEDVKIVLADPEGSGLYNKVSLSMCTDLSESARIIVGFFHWFSVAPDLPLIAGKSCLPGPISESGLTSFRSYLNPARIPELYHPHPVQNKPVLLSPFGFAITRGQPRVLFCFPPPWLPLEIFVRTLMEHFCAKPEFG